MELNEAQAPLGTGDEGGGVWVEVGLGVDVGVEVGADDGGGGGWAQAVPVRRGVWMKTVPGAVPQGEMYVCVVVVPRYPWVMVTSSSHPQSWWFLSCWLMEAENSKSAEAEMVVAVALATRPARSAFAR